MLTLWARECGMNDDLLDSGCLVKDVQSACR